MNFIVSELIKKKRDGFALSDDELHFLVQGFADGSIPDYQITAWLMAVFFKGMTSAETLKLTYEMKNSGEQLHWRNLDPKLKTGFFVDKHSTGGVGDKVSLILAPLVASLGFTTPSKIPLKIPMMSGRGLGFTGGTVDKLQSISGFNMFLNDHEKVHALVESGYCMMAQNESLCPADRKLYSLRDVTATIESLPLITGSIVSKKWAAGVENILYDVKCGSAAFMTDFESAKTLAESLVAVSKNAGMKAKAIITRMDEPLGALIGNALEVKESVYILKNEFPNENMRRLAMPLRDLCVDFAVEMALLADPTLSQTGLRESCYANLENGHAWELFEKNLFTQGATSDWWNQLELAPILVELKAPRDGYIQKIDSRHIGIAGIEIKAGRRKSEDTIDAAVGFEMLCAPGDSIKKGDTMVLCHLRDKAQFDLIQDNFIEAITIADKPIKHHANLRLAEVT